MCEGEVLLRAVKAQAGVELRVHAFLMSAPERGERPALRSGHITPEEINSRCHHCVDRRAGLDVSEKTHFWPLCDVSFSRLADLVGKTARNMRAA